MAVNKEVKGQLARLLATEDLLIEHKKVSTASFNVLTRVLTLPQWERASNTVYDLLVAHEVGHALYTPNEDWTHKIKIPKDFINITEDVRIEKLIKRRYAGLSKTMYNGYKELNDDDFFSIGEDDLSKYNMADRVNIYFKIGNFCQINFTDTEKKLIELIASTETFDEAIHAAEELYKYCKNEMKGDMKLPEMNSHEVEIISGQGSNQTPNQISDKLKIEDSQQGGQESKLNTEEPIREDSTNKSDNNEISDNIPEGKNLPEIKTTKNLEDAIKNLVNTDGTETVYVELPNLNLDTVIADNKEIYEYIDKSWEHATSCDSFKIVDSEYIQFKNSAQKEVNYLVKEFECRKAADSYARASTSRTGILDCTRLHTYKHNEDLFKKVTTFADGKNHGLVFVLDWSGSMEKVMLDTIKQLYNLIWFCKKVAIPFEVYAFTQEWAHTKYDDNGKFKSHPPQHYDKKSGLVVVDSHFNLMNFFSSKTSSVELEKQMIKIFRIAKAYRASYDSTYGVPSRVHLSGTPLNEALIALHQILPKFQRDNKLQKVHTIVLTDGEASPLPYHQEIQRTWESEIHMGCRGFSPCTTILRDRKTGNTYSIKLDEKSVYQHYTNMLLRNLRDKFPHVSFIGMRILGSGESGSFIKNYSNYGEELIKLQDSWKKNKSFTIKNSGYHSYFGLSSNALDNSSEFIVDNDASKSQIRNAFKKSLTSKKLNKKILGEFIQLVA
jgi:hypothetical protein